MNLLSFPGMPVVFSPVQPFRRELPAADIGDPLRGDIGDPPTGWCTGRCACGNACTEFANHRARHSCDHC